MRGDLHQQNLLSGENMAPLRNLGLEMSCESASAFVAYVLNLGTQLEYWAAKVIFRPATALFTRFEVTSHPHSHTDRSYRLPGGEEHAIIPIACARV